MSHLMNNYGRLPISFDHGQGVWLWDKEGNKYLDALAGIAVNSVGHAHPRLVRAISDQAAKLIHCSNYFNIDLQEQVAEKLVEHSGLDAVFFCNSGLEANECAIKIARKFGHLKGIDVPHIIVMKHAFHGRSIATLSATGNPSVKADFSPYTEGFIPVEEGNLEEVEKIVKEDKNVVAILFEPILGEGGVIPLELSYMRGLRELCDQNDILMMCDEIQSGVGRSGKWFAHQWAEVKPDVMTLAKGLAGGVPVGAVVVSEKANILKPGNHGSTFGGNPLAMRAALETLSIIEEEKLVDNAFEVGKKLKKALSKSLNGFSGVLEIRGKGLMLGIVLDRDAHDILEPALKAGLTFSVTAGNVIRLVPPLILTEAEADEIVKRITPVIRAFLALPKI
ncbi:aspartate aminotransferase family protein [Parasutterella muris]|uniref:Acetylornithine aminotransferase n=1 Tax=Parasutterella muris TaxID=2565572 RepID=A0A6L6YPV5_9BURK|nr:aspartate aminotransferase family protein [Parasutterella muris]MVX57701.1 acetylornithine/succinylornithine family transaminase [Parasutterella muris]